VGHFFGVSMLPFGSMAYVASGDFRWTARRKLELIVMMRSGQVARETLQKQFGVSDEELAEWLRRYGNGDDRARRRLRATDMTVRYAPRLQEAAD
jgi:transposase-like protein